MLVTIAAWVGFIAFLLVGCVLVDIVCDLVAARRRLRRLRTRTVVRPRGVVSSPDRRGECSPRLAAAPTIPQQRS